MATVPNTAVLVNYHPFFWYRHGPEYRYALEVFFNINVGDYGENDYKMAQVLYFIDEGKIDNPLQYKCMEMEAFGPKKIERTLKLSDGRKIYFLTK